MKISFNICFWSFQDTSNRIRNTKFAWSRLKMFIDYYNRQPNQPHKLEGFLFDLSENKVIDDAIHIPLTDYTYERSKKLNLCIEWNHLNYNPDVICFLDSDVFFLEDQYTLFSNIINNFDRSKFITSDVFDIQDNSYVDFENLCFNQSPPIIMRHIPGLGAFFMIDFDTLVQIGGFDERFTVWGGEDDDLRYRLERKQTTRITLPVKIFHLNHDNLIEHANVINKEQKAKQLECWKELNIVRDTLLSKYRRKNG
jgi:predicted glycosyltransferase involved in capsule biosynthesis